LGYFGDGPWSHRALDKLIQDEKIEVSFVVPRFDLRDPVLVKKAEETGIPVLYLENINSEDSLGSLDRFKCDLFVSMSYNQIIRAPLRNIPKYGFINCHAGKLPEYRGRNILNWALINDEIEFGITVHYIDDGIDTGDILAQKTYPITDQDDYKTLLEIAYDGCADILFETISRFACKDIPKPIVQSKLGPGFYCGRREPGDEVLDWNQSSREIFNFVRALTFPGVGAHTYLENNKVVIWKVELMPDVRSFKGICGQVIGRDDKGVVVKTADSCIRVIDVSLGGQERFVPKFPIGKRFNLKGKE
jgi:methionyl-tRNA formyltransferase